MTTTNGIVDMPPLPGPDCSYADHSYPAYSRKFVSEREAMWVKHEADLRDRLASAQAKIAELETLLASAQIDAERWREMLLHVGGAAAPQRFVFRYLATVEGAHIMKGSVASHFTDAIDAAIAARAQITNTEGN